MIYTVTLNPAVDYVVHVPALTQGQILRSTREQVFFGGKGVNVSSVLHTLGVASVATGFWPGLLGRAIEAELARQGIGTDFVFLPDGFTRINLKLRTGVETDINGGGPVIGPADLAALEEKLTRLQAGDIAVLAGECTVVAGGRSVCGPDGASCRSGAALCGRYHRRAAAQCPAASAVFGQAKRAGVGRALWCASRRRRRRLSMLPGCRSWGPGTFWSPWARRGRYWRTRPGASGSSPPAGARR